MEPSTDLAATIQQTAHANCWHDRIKVHANAVTASEAEDGKRVVFKGGWRLDDRGKQRVRPQNVTLLAVQRLLRGRRVDLGEPDMELTWSRQAGWAGSELAAGRLKACYRVDLPSTTTVYKSYS